MARLAVLRKRAAVRIAVARRATVEGRHLELHDSLLSRRRRMAFLAGRPHVSSGQREARTAVIELRRLPAFGRVATLAIPSELTAMHVLMALRTLARQTQVRTLQVLHLDALALDFRDARRVVALRTLKLSVLAFERVTRRRVIELAGRRVPLDELEVLAVVLGMAAGACLVRALRAHQRRVEPALPLQPERNLHMAVEALEAGGAFAQFVARSAARGAAEGLMRAR